jgi:ATPase subunit of ABC transporter with duplicated ATPase domains
MSKINLVCENLSYSVESKKLFSNIFASFGNEKVGLIGANGTGKTTLLKIIIGELTPQTGIIHKTCKIGYMPQNFVVNQDETIAQVFGIKQKMDALEKINSGSALPSNFEIVGDDWDVIERAKELLHRCKLDDLELSRQIKTLSGGQTTRVFLARLLMDKTNESVEPNFLILDEPTNNLDSESRLALYDVIKKFNGGMLVVSHDRELLSLMDQIIELSPLGLKTYGGNYADYVEQKRVEQEALEQDLIDAQKHLSKTKRVIQETKEKYEKRVSMGNKARRSGSQPKMLLDYFKNRAEATKSKLEERTDKQISTAKDNLLIAKSKLEQKELLDFELEATRVHNTKLVLEIQNLFFAYPECQPMEDSIGALVVSLSNHRLEGDGPRPIIKDFSMTLVGPKRISIAGKNGSGKTTLLKLIMGQLIPTSGCIKVGVQHCAYLDQALSVLNPDQTILENFKRLNPNVKETDCRLRLAAFLFAHDDALKLVGNLSGGEKMRAALACVLMGDTPPQLILLDEPTNNMDLESIASIERALRSYKGALLAVSHDATFLQNIGVEDKIEMIRFKKVS